MVHLLTLLLLSFLFIHPICLVGQAHPAYLQSNEIILGKGSGFRATSNMIEIINGKELHIAGDYLMIIATVNNTGSEEINDIVGITTNINTASRKDYNILVSNDFNRRYFGILGNTFKSYNRNLDEDTRTLLSFQRNTGPTWLGRPIADIPLVMISGINNQRHVSIGSKTPTQSLFVNGNLIVRGKVQGNIGVVSHNISGVTQTDETVLTIKTIQFEVKYINHNLVLIGMATVSGNGTVNLIIEGTPSITNLDCIFPEHNFQAGLSETVTLTAMCTGVLSNGLYDINLKANFSGGTGSIVNTNTAGLFTIGLPMSSISGSLPSFTDFTLPSSLTVPYSRLYEPDQTYLTRGALSFEKGPQMIETPSLLYFVDGKTNSYVDIKARSIHAQGYATIADSVLLVSTNTMAHSSSQGNYSFIVGGSASNTNQIKFSANPKFNGVNALITHNIQAVDSVNSPTTLFIQSPITIGDDMFTVSQSGHVGINGLPDSNYKLKVYGNVVGTGQLQIDNGNYSVIVSTKNTDEIGPIISDNGDITEFDIASLTIDLDARKWSLIVMSTAVLKVTETVDQYSESGRIGVQIPGASFLEVYDPAGDLIKTSEKSIYEFVTQNDANTITTLTNMDQTTIDNSSFGTHTYTIRLKGYVGRGNISNVGPRQYKMQCIGGGWSGWNSDTSYCILILSNKKCLLGCNDTQERRHPSNRLNAQITANNASIHVIAFPIP